MWLATQLGFYSIVQKPPGQFHVRARCRADLENLISHAGLDFPIHHTPDGDYAWRIVGDASLLKAVFSALPSTVDYANFKSRIHAIPGQKSKTSAYSRLWSDLLKCQRDPQ